MMTADRNPLFDEAAQRWLAHRAGTADSAARAELAAWLETSERHAEAWRLAEQAWRLSRMVGPAIPPLEPPRLKPMRRAAIVLAAAAIAACLGPRRHSRSPALAAGRLSDRPGQVRIVSLDDGTQVQLDSGSAIARI